MKEQKPFIFMADRGDGEWLKVMYSQGNDTFFQLQESLNDCSLFLGKAIMKGKLQLTYNSMIESKSYLITEIDPMFFMLKALRMGLLPG